MGSRSIGSDCDSDCQLLTYHSENSGPNGGRSEGAKVLNFRCRWRVHFAVTVGCKGVLLNSHAPRLRELNRSNFRVECAFAVRDVRWPTERSGRTIQISTGFANRLLYENLAIMARGFYFYFFIIHFDSEFIPARFSFRSLTEYCVLVETFIGVKLCFALVMVNIILSLLIRKPQFLFYQTEIEWLKVELWNLIGLLY